MLGTPGGDGTSFEGVGGSEVGSAPGDEVVTIVTERKGREVEEVNELGVANGELAIKG